MNKKSTFSKAQILSSLHYPYGLQMCHAQKKSLSSYQLRHSILLGLGSNLTLGTHNSIEILESVFRWFASNSRIQIQKTSPIWRNPPFGYKAQNEFYNALLLCKTSLSIVGVYTLIFYVERRFGRERKRIFKNAPRTLDIDLILYDDIRLKRPYLEVPHKFYTMRPSVMLPMSFLG